MYKQFENEQSTGQVYLDGCQDIFKRNKKE